MYRTYGLRTAPAPHSLGCNSRNGLCRSELVFCMELLQSNLLLTDGHHIHGGRKMADQDGFFCPRLLSVIQYFGLLTAVIVPTARTIMNDPQFCGFCQYEDWPIDANLMVLMHSGGPSWWCHLGLSSICMESPFSTITHNN